MNDTPTQRCHILRTRKGKVLRVVHDRYSRSDLACGIMHGRSLTAGALADLLLESENKHALLVDTNVALHQIDILEYQCPGISTVIVLQTVLQELCHLNLSVYRRLLALLKDTNKQFVYYANDASSFTKTSRSRGETINDCNDRAIRSSTHYYQSVLKATESGSSCSAVLLTNDADNRKKARAEGLQCYGMRDYVDSFLSKYPEIRDVLSADSLSNSALLSGLSSYSYPPHLSPQELSAGLKGSRFHRGTLRCQSRFNWLECYVVLHSAEGEPRRSAFVVGRESINRAMEGDVVAVELLDAPRLDSADAALQSILAARNAERQQGQVAEVTAEASVESVEGLHTSAPGAAQLYGRVVGIVRRSWRQYAGSLDASGEGDVAVDAEGTLSVLFHPVDKRVPPVRMLTRRREELLGNRLLVGVDSWPADSLYPQGHYIRNIGRSGDRDVETQILLHEFDVPVAAFSAEVMACLPPADWRIPPDVLARRTDLRKLPIVSIDPPGCKDIDDALHCVELPNGNLQLGVHIADVTHFVHPDTAIDREAAHRCTSTYLVERRLDMLPGLLTTQLCSLRSGEDHLAFSVVWEMRRDATIVDVQFFKSVIHSAASLTYDEAQAMLDDAGSCDEVAKSVKALNSIARILRANRIEQGALTLASPEVRFKLDAENENNPTDVNVYVLKESNALVEEFMLLANITVAKKVLRHFPTLGVLRRHQPPSKQQFTPLLRAAEAAGARLDIMSSKTLADSLDLAIKSDDPYFNKLLRILSTRCMMPAQYFCSGEVPKDQWHHYGLAAPVYTHFTSPIRRYADVLVHRLLAAAIGVIPLPAGNADRSKQQELCSVMNRRHKAAQYAQRASVNLYTLLFFSKPAKEVAYVLTLSDTSAAVLVPKFGVEGLVSYESICKRLSSVGPLRVEFDAGAHAVEFLQESGQVALRLAVFQQVSVGIRVEEGSAGDRSLVIELEAAPARPAPEVAPGQGPKKKKQKSNSKA